MYSICKKTGVGLIKFNNPPVNSLGHALRLGIAQGLEQAHKDKVPAIVMAGDGKNFSAGADIAEFAVGGHAKTPSLNEVIAMMDTATIPIVAGIDGVCLGGGFETALGAHWRVAGKAAKLGLPEVHLGILPGAGGTQRLPRLTGVPNAVDLIVSGRHIGAKEALSLGVVDQVTADPIVDAAVAFAVSEAVKSTPVANRRISAKAVPGDVSDELFEQVRAKVKASARGFVAPLSIVEAIRWSAKASSFEEGMEKEKELITKLFEGTQSKALQYFFFSERKVSTPPAGTALPVQSAGVIGGGTMGAGIAMCLAQAGISTTLVESTADKAADAMKRIEKTYKSSSAYKSGKQTDADVAAVMSKINAVADETFSSLANADIVIEAIFENMALKKEIFAKLDKACKPSAILASNTSYLDIDEIGAATSRPSNVVGTHFFSPANVMKLLEVVKGSKSSPEAIATSMNIGKKIGKTTVLAGNCFGFIGNRMLSPYSYESIFLVEEGASPSQVDRVLKTDIGMAMGPFEMKDLAGNDVMWRIRQQQGLTTGNPKDRVAGLRWDAHPERYCTLPDKLCEAGHFGQKTSRGWYKYDPANPRKPIEDEETKRFIEEHRKEVQLPPRVISSGEIIERCLFSMVNEGFKILEEGIAATPEDIDVVYIYGYGFPRYRGGPMWWAEKEIGLQKVLEAINKQHAFSPDIKWWKPSQLLKDCVASGASIREELHFRAKNKNKSAN